MTRPLGKVVKPAEAGGDSRLPADLLLDSSRRLAWVSLTFGLVYFLFFTLLIAVVSGFGQRETFPGEAVAVYGSVIFSLITFVVARRRLLSPEKLVDYGLIFQVVAGFGIAFTENWGIFGAEIGNWFGISWLCAWIIMFPLVVPATPGKTLLAAIVTATMGPLAYMLSVAFDRSPLLPSDILLRLFLPNYISVLIAFYASGVLYRLTTKVRDARQIGRYELTELLGRGGMGEVWRARHRFLSRPAAIKLIQPEALAPDSPIRSDIVRKRFEREAEATSQLRSPHSIVIYDFGTEESGAFYYVMEHLEGVDMETMVRRFGPISSGRTLFLLKQMCHSLADAHSIGLIHRDIKPSNIFVCKLGQDHDFVKILDFGLVRSTQEPAVGPTQLTESDIVMGTPAFLAPEMAMGGGDIDGRVDIYSVGCVAYWLVTGQLVFEARTPAEMVVQHVTSMPTPPSMRSEVGIPEDLERIILSCLEKSPDARPQTADELYGQLDRCEGTWGEEDARQWWQHHLPDSTIPREPRRDGL
jgi:tRNA A-37 threonylcarbamoyl transferase component Bud32